MVDIILTANNMVSHVVNLLNILFSLGDAPGDLLIKYTTNVDKKETNIKCYNCLMPRQTSHRNYFFIGNVNWKLKTQCFICLLAWKWNM